MPQWSAVPDAATDQTVPGDLTRQAVGFARLLRGAGLDIPIGNTIAFGEALAAVGIDRRDSVYWAGRATLLRRPEDTEVYDRAFRAWWDHDHDVSFVAVDARELNIAFDATDDGDGDDGTGDDDTEATPTLAVRYSPAEVLRHRDFALYSPAEFAEARRLM